MTNNSIFTRVLALMLCLIMLVGGLTACFNEVDPENNIGTTTNGGVVTTNPTTKPTTTTTTTPTTGGVVEDDPVEDPVEPVDPNEIFSASTDILSDGLIYGTLASDVVIGGTEMGALVPADVKVEAGASNLALSVKKVDEVLLSDALSTLDVHINGVASDNTVPMVVKLGAILEAGLGATELKLYHTENGVDNLMTRVNSPADFAIHNQYYYNAETGEVTIYVASFSVFYALKSEADVWDGSSDTTWYNENDTEFILTTAEQLAGFRDLVDGGNTFEGKTVKLGADIDLYLEQKDEQGNTIKDGEVPALVSFDPIGKGYVHNGGQAFMGTFDGQGHTIYNLYQNGWDLGYSYSTVGGGLFASIKDATIKNLAVSGANIVMECIDMGTVVGYAQGKCTFENIVITDSKLANYQRYTGGVVGEVCKGDSIEDEYTHTFTNVTVDSSVKISSLWGDFDNACGGVIGGKWGTARVLMQNVTVACEIDAFSDVTAAYQWYAYRRCGMLIGHTEQNSPKSALNAAAEFLTCENVNVYYGDWVNYTYYQFAEQTDEAGTRLWNSNYPWVRAEAGEYNGAFSNVRYGNPIVNGEPINNVERAKELGAPSVTIIFNQLYGGGQGVYGCAEHDGVTTNSKEFKTIYVHNTASWENLKLQYWFANGNDTWTTIIDGIDMNTMLVEGNVYKIQLPVSVYAFKIVADGQDGEEFVLGNLESNANVYPGCEHTYKNACDADCNVCGATREVTHTPGDVATCTTAQVCTVCDTELVKALGHTAVVDKAVAATCTTAGKTEGSHCSVCNTVIKAQTTVAAKGHDWKADAYKCSGCGLVAEKKTVYFQNNWEWSDVRIYYWSSDVSYYEAWPGKEMTLDHYDGKYNIYKFDIPSYAEEFNINGIKNNGSGERDETPTIEVSSVSSDYFYYMNFNNGNEAKLSPRVVYLVPNSNWKVDNARFAAYFFNNSTGKNTWVSMEWDSTKNAYKCNVPDGQWEAMIYCRMNPNASANNWDNKWNQTSDLTIPSNGNNCYTVKDGTWDKGGGSWSTK